MHIELQSAAPLIVAAVDLLLGVVILLQNPRGLTNIAYTIFAASVTLWGVGVGGFYIASDPVFIDFFARFLYLAGGSIPATFLFFALIFDEPRRPSAFKSILVFLPTLVFVLLYFFTDLIIAGYTVTYDGLRGYEYGPLRYLFDLHLWGYFAWALIVLGKKYYATDKPAREHVAFITFGTYSVLAIAGATNVVGPIFGVFDLVWVGPSSTIIWTWVVAYAVIKHQLFNIRTIAAELLIIALWLVLLARTILSNSVHEIFINASFFAITVVLGTFVIRSVMSEVRQRELIEIQEKELQVANQQQESLLHFISHEIKGYLTKNEAAFDAIRVGDYGQISPELQEMSSTALADTRKGVETIISILDASNFKRGTVSYKKQSFDLVGAVEEIVADLQKEAATKGLTLTFHKPVTGAFAITGDEEKIRRHVIRNVIDNSIKYTPSGSVAVDLAKTDAVYRITVKDTGVGITEDDMKRLFTEGGHGKESIKVNVHSTGYGLFIAKQVVEAHGGKIWAESEGAGKGSRFIIELPIGA